jgi:uncharacterized membrane protein YhaH (DUF805 family)
MNFMEAVSTALKNYKNLHGRASRPEFWYWYAFIVVVNLLTSLPVIYTAMMVGQDQYYFVLPFVPAQLAIMIFLIMPTVAVVARRLHDTDLSGWYMLLFLLPAIGWLIMVVMMAQPSKPGANRFGV